MHNIHDLEKRWLNYKIKSYLPHAGAAITTLLLLIYIYKAIEAPKIKEQKSVIKEEKIKQVEQVVLEKKEPLKEVIQIKIELDKDNNPDDDKVLILNPSLDFMKNLRISSIATHELETEKTNPLQTKDLSSIEKNTNIKDINIEEEKIYTEEKAPTLSLIKQETMDDINHVIQRFRKNNNPALSLFIAKKYYKLKDYHKAYNYALVTNGINKNIDESWIIFSKSLVKLGKKNMALKTLTQYIDQSNSTNAKILFNDIKSGKFK